MNPRIARALSSFALILSLTTWANGQGKPADLPLEYPGSVSPQIPFDQHVDNQLTPLFIQRTCSRHVVDETGCVIETLTAPPQTHTVAFPGLGKFRPAARKCMAASFLFGAHPLLALAPVEPWLDMPCDHPVPVQDCPLVLNEGNFPLQQPVQLGVGVNSDAGITGSIVLPCHSFCQPIANLTLSWQVKSGESKANSGTLTLGFTGVCCPRVLQATHVKEPSCLGKLIQATGIFGEGCQKCENTDAVDCKDSCPKSNAKERVQNVKDLIGLLEQTCPIRQCGAEAGECPCCVKETPCPCATACKCADGKRCDPACKCDGGKGAPCTACKCQAGKKGACKCTDGKRCDPACKCGGKEGPCSACKCGKGGSSACKCEDGKRCDPACKCGKTQKEGCCPGCKCKENGTTICPEPAPAYPLFEELEDPEEGAEFIPWYDSYDAFDVKIEAPRSSLLRASCADVDFTQGKFRLSCQVELNGTTYKVRYDRAGLTLKAE